MRWSAQIHACLPVAGVTWDALKRNRASSRTGLSPSVAGLSRPFCSKHDLSNLLPQSGGDEASRDTAHANPISVDTCVGLGCSAFARRY